MPYVIQMEWVCGGPTVAEMTISTFLTLGSLMHLI